jgi:hypothetical protein
MTALRLILILLLLASVGMAAAATHYVRAGASGANNGTDWNNAFTSLPATLNRGDTYYVAAGFYGTDYAFDDNNSGTTPVTMKKATVADHGTDTGWNNAYANGWAEWSGEWSFPRDYYFITGNGRDGTTWTNDYGFKVRSIWNYAETDGGGGDHITLLYVEVTGNKTFWGQNWCTNMNGGVDIKGPGWKTNFVMGNCFIAHPSFIQLSFVRGFSITNSVLAHGNRKQSIRGTDFCPDGEILNCRFYEAANGNVNELGAECSPGTGDESHTAVVAVWDDNGNGAGAFDNWTIKGNNIWYQDFVPGDGPNGAIIVGGGTGWDGVPASNVTISTNTIVGYGARNASIIINGGDAAGSSKIAQGNKWQDCSSYFISVTGTTADNGNLGAAPWTTWNQFIAYGLPEEGGGEPEAPAGATMNVGTLTILGP